MKTCDINSKNECILRKNKDNLCCLHDIEDNLTLILPSLDKIKDSLAHSYSESSCNTILSKTIYILTIINAQNELEESIIHAAKEGIYLIYHTDLRADLTPLIKAFISDLTKWFEYKLVSSEHFNEEHFFASLASDLATIKQATDIEEEVSDTDLDDLFF